MIQVCSAPSLIPHQGESPSSPLDAILHRAADKLSTLRLTRIAGSEMDKSDAQALVSDLLAIANVIDPVIQGIGEYATQFLPGLDLSLFVDQLRGALEGNATFALCVAVEEREEDRRNEAYQAAHSLRHQWLDAAE